MKQKFADLFRSNVKEKITAILFVVFIFVMLIGMLIKNPDFKDAFIESYREAVPTGAPVVDRLSGAIESMEDLLDDDVFHRGDFIEIYGLAQLAQAKHAVTDYNYGALYKTRDGQTTFSVPKKNCLDAVTNAVLLQRGLAEKGIDFLYIQLPFKVQPPEYGGDKELPVYVHDYANSNADTFLEMMGVYGINTYDIRDQFFSSGLPMSELFFDTDHHWKIRGALMATGFIADFLNQNYDFGIPEGLYAEDNFDTTTYEASYIGSMGRRVGRIYGGIDDFTLYTPKFDTNLTLTQIEGISQVQFEGSFSDAVIEWKYIDDPEPTTNRYAAYHGDYQELRFVNNLAQNDSKVLIIKDSFGIPVYSFLSLGIKEVRAIDMRLFEKSVLEYAAEYNPDLVVVMYNGDSFVKPMFDFNLDE